MVALLHGVKAAKALLIERGVETAVKQRHDHLPQIGAARHPLIVAAATVLIGTIKPAAGKPGLNPMKESLVIGVHSEGYLGLPAIASEVSLADQETHEDPEVEIRELLFHCQVSRGTRQGLRCFTVM
jgi:hypothetical protein